MADETLELRLRPATQADVVEILRLLLAVHQESTVELPPVNPGKTIREISHCLEVGWGFMLGAKTEAGWVIAGSIGLYEETHWYTDEKNLTDLWFTVRPQYRSYKAARLLLTQAWAIAKSQGLVLRQSDMTGIRPEKKTKLYERLGYRQIGGMYFKGDDNGQGE